VTTFASDGATVIAPTADDLKILSEMETIHFLHQLFSKLHLLLTIVGQGWSACPATASDLPDLKGPMFLHFSALRPIRNKIEVVLLFHSFFDHNSIRGKRYEKARTILK
jgi:hypothetical protein